MLDFVVKPLSSLLAGARTAVGDDLRDAAAEPHRLEERLGHLIRAVERSGESVERHIEVIERLSDSVTVLTGQLDALLTVIAPLAAAERDVQRVEGFFRRGSRRTRPSAD